MTTNSSDYDRRKELEEFEDTKLGVKGLFDSGITHLPRIFHHPPETLFDHNKAQTPNPDDEHIIPVIDLSGKHEEVVKQLRDASAKFGFFQVINHGISVSLMDRLLDAVKAFHELQPDEKMQVYRRETVTAATGVGFYSNYDLFHSKAASWRDTLAIRLAPVPVNPNEIPDVCRTVVIEWDKEVKQLAEQLMGLLSEGLGLRADKLTGTSYLGRRALAGQYYPYCPEPNKTVGIASHTDPGILTVLLQDQVGGLQVIYDGNWINLKPVRGALVVNLGDLFQIISNDEYKSGEHRVYANPFLKPRVSIATFLSPGIYENLYGPLLELVSPERPALYQHHKFSDFVKNFFSKELEGKSMTSYFRLKLKDEYDRRKELREFEDTKLGVKGLVDSGITQIPRIFHFPPETLFDQPNQTNPSNDQIIPVIDLSGEHEDLVQQLRDASAKFGFFQVINHGMSISLLDRLSDAVQAFHEMQPQEKMQVYRRDTITAGTGVGFYSNYDLFHSKAAGWQDTLAVCLAPIPVDPNEIPEVCRAEVIEWDKEVKQLGEKLMKMLCKGLGVGADKLTGKSYIGRRTMVGQYYPYCPEPDKTVGIALHTDPGILTVLLQDQVGGLQVKYNGNWINLKPFHGALVVNIGDLLQIISNDIYKSGEHREYQEYQLLSPLAQAVMTISMDLSQNWFHLISQHCTSKSNFQIWSRFSSQRSWKASPRQATFNCKHLLSKTNFNCVSYA